MSKDNEKRKELEKIEQSVSAEDLNEYALEVMNKYFSKLAEKLEEKKERIVIKGVNSILQNNQYTVTVTCYFSNDIEKIANKIIDREKWRVLESKNYLEHPKKNGYRGIWFRLAIPYKDVKNENAVINIRIHTIGMEYWLEMEEQISKGQQIIGKESLKEYSKHILDIENKIYKKIK